ncbi:PhzF family phenazine biosynthesis protein [Paraburkholderia sp. MMS20-SJTR3]|uniref:PhzF family phenazine biosynthesis protein n=1 Tax=Paraburkholderia sejongensis TaxID=2886946 RepID=A0ABS8K2C3_9BURK|nr:PhzF family phenazine biosynthesis protein [Paraburkholderia sp. MMS20-SJTR3]MCC8396302.1 PhzF family phenazine biosynthesis protein [Paraburkholderia sp. MMS20-SJTR3]
MPVHNVRFKQVDVFTSTPFKGNPLAVVFDADTLDSAQMQTIARWTNLSETTFLLQPDHPAADYRVRIFTPGGELPFAGHPTLGTAHALLESGYQPKRAGKLIQQCGVGLVELEELEHPAAPAPAGTSRAWAFAAPPARVAPLGEDRYEALATALRSSAIDFSAPPCAVDNGAPWLIVRVDSARSCLALEPDALALAELAHSVDTHGIAVYGPHEPDGPATFEIRCLMAGGGFGTGEDPVTGSANAALAGLLQLQHRCPGARYTARQGTVLGRAGEVSVHYDDARGKIWIGGPTVTIVDGTCRLA